MYCLLHLSITLHGSPASNVAGLIVCAECVNRYANKRPVSGLTSEDTKRDTGPLPLPLPLSGNASRAAVQLQANLASQPRATVRVESPTQPANGPCPVPASAAAPDHLDHRGECQGSEVEGSEGEGSEGKASEGKSSEDDGSERGSSEEEGFEGEGYEGGFANDGPSGGQGLAGGISKQEVLLDFSLQEGRASPKAFRDSISEAAYQTGHDKIVCQPSKRKRYAICTEQIAASCA